MPITKDAYEIPTDWVSVNSLTGIAVGDVMLLQNVGIPGDLIILATSDTEPASDFRGVSLDQIKEFLQVTAGEAEVWAKFKRIDKGPTFSRVGLLQVQDV